MLTRNLIFALACAALGACATTIDVGAQPALRAVTPATPSAYTFGPGSSLIRFDGQPIGSIRTAPWAESVALGIVANGVTAGTYRLLLHGVGRCDTPDFSTAGTAQVGQAGRLAPPDLGSVSVGPDGKIYMTKLAYGMKLRASDPGDLPALLDADGAALVIHANERRIACAVLR